MSFRSKFVDGSDATEYQRQIAPLIHAAADAVTEQDEVEEGPSPGGKPGSLSASTEK